MKGHSHTLSVKASTKDWAFPKHNTDFLTGRQLSLAFCDSCPLRRNRWGVLFGASGNLGEVFEPLHEQS